jgi:hypothetical protein
MNLAETDIAQGSRLGSGRSLDCELARLRKQAYVLAVGRSGLGKSAYAMGQVLNSLLEGHSVDVIDVGKTYFKLCELVGGTKVLVQADGQHVEQRDGDAALRIYEHEMLLRTRWGDDLQFPAMGSPEDRLLVVDELWQVVQIYPNLQDLVSAHLNGGGSVILCSMDGYESGLVQGFLRIPSPDRVRRLVVNFQSGVSSANDERALI